MASLLFSFPFFCCVLGKKASSQSEELYRYFEKSKDLRLDSKILSPSGELSGSIYFKKNPFS